MDEIAAQGTTFLNAYCQQAICGPSRASVMTGKYPDFTQVWDLKTKIRDIHPNIITLTQYFIKYGYHTAGIGKIFDPRSVGKEVDSASWSERFTQTWHLKYNIETGKPSDITTILEVKVSQVAATIPTGIQLIKNSLPITHGLQLKH